MKKGRAVGRLGKTDDGQRRGAQACCFEGRTVPSYEILTGLPGSG